MVLKNESNDDGQRENKDDEERPHPSPVRALGFTSWYVVGPSLRFVLWVHVYLSHRYSRGRRFARP